MDLDLDPDLGEVARMQSTPTRCGSRLPTLLKTKKYAQSREMGTSP